MNGTCHSMKTGSVIGTLRDGGGTQTLPALIEPFCTQM